MLRETIKKTLSARSKVLIKTFLFFCFVDENQGGEAFFLIKLQFNDGNVRIEVVVFL